MHFVLFFFRQERSDSSRPPRSQKALQNGNQKTNVLQTYTRRPTTWHEALRHPGRNILLLLLFSLSHRDRAPVFKRRCRRGRRCFLPPAMYVCTPTEGGGRAPRQLNHRCCLRLGRLRCAKPPKHKRRPYAHRIGRSRGVRGQTGMDSNPYCSLHGRAVLYNHGYAVLW